MIRARLLLCLGLLLFACAPVATVAKPDTKFLQFAELPSRDLEVVGKGPIEGGTVQVIGLELVLRSPFCDLPGCAASPDGFVRLTYPGDGKTAYPRRLTIDVVRGVPIKGRALMNLVGEDVSRPAPLVLE